MGIAAKPIPPNKVNKNQLKKEINPIVYIGKETFKIKSSFFVMQLSLFINKTVDIEDDCIFLIGQFFVVIGI